jgi:hypothetical protein
MSEIREQAELQRMFEETKKFVAEHDKLVAESRKLEAEARKLNIDRWLAPAIVILGGLGSAVAGFAAVWRLLTG